MKNDEENYNRFHLFAVFALTALICLVSPKSANIALRDYHAGKEIRLWREAYKDL